MGAAAGFAQMGLGGLQMLNGIKQGKTIRQQAEFDAKQSEFNASLVKYQQEDIQEESENAIFRREQQVNQMLGSQKVSLASQGIDVEGDLGTMFEEEEREIGLEDVQAIKNNAWRESMGLEIKKHDILTQAKATRLQGESKANAAAVEGLLGGASSMIDGFSKTGLKPKRGAVGVKTNSGKYASGTSIFSKKR